MNEELIYPPGRKPGCLPRRSKVGEICRRFDEAVKVIPIDEWDKYIGKISCKPHLRQILDQDSIGSCATESTTQGDMTVSVARGQDFVLLNPWFIYNTTSGGSDRGSNIDDNLQFARTYGIAPESVWPRSKGWRATPSDEAKKAALNHRIVEFFDITSKEEFGTALLLGFPVVFGYSGHSICAVELVSDDEIKYANSWGDWTDCGDPGYGVCKFRSVVWGYGAFAVRTTTDASPPDPVAYINDVLLPRRAEEKKLLFETWPHVAAA